MTMRNIPVTVGFAIITTCQLVLGLWMLALSVINGGEAAEIVNQTTLTHDVSVPCSQTAIGHTPRRVPLVRAKLS